MILYHFKLPPVSYFRGAVDRSMVIDVLYKLLNPFVCTHATPDPRIGELVDTHFEDMKYDV